MKKFLFAVLFAAAVTTVSSACSNPAIAQDAEGEWGHLTGQIIVEGEVPALKPEAVGDHADKAVCLVDGEIPLDDNLVVDEESNGLRDVYVMMYQKKPTPVPTHPDYEEAKAEPVVIDNVKCRFVPKAVFVRPGQKVILRNSDPVGHNCHITSFNNEHNLNLPANGEVELVLENEDKIPGKVACDLHAWMDSVIMIRDNPYVTTTDAEGKFTIENLPAGDWKFQFWHKEGGYLRKLNVGDGLKVGRKGEVELTIAKDETNDLGAMTIAIDELVKD
jgi:plastocyanin